MEAGSLATTIRGDRALTARSSRSRAIDPLLKWVLSGLAALILVLIAFFFIRLYIEAKPAFDKYGYLSFVFDNSWVPSQQLYGALPLLVGTIITSVIALVLGVPVAISSGFIAESVAPKSTVPALNCAMPPPEPIGW